MGKINILIACEFTIFRNGIKSLIENINEFEIIGETSDFSQIIHLLGKKKPTLLIVNVSKKADSINSVCKEIHFTYPAIPILLFLDSSLNISVPECIVNGVRGIIWKENSKDELIEAITKLSEGGLFFENPDNCKLSCHLSHNLKKIYNPKQQSPLSIREIEIINLITEGYAYKEIATKLFISPRTVESHKNNLLEKLNLRSVNELIRYAIINNL